MSHKKFNPWLIVVLLALIIAGGLLLIRADTVLAPVLTIATDQDRVEIYATAIRQKIQAQGGGFQKGPLYLRGETDDRAGDPSLKEAGSVAIPPVLRDGLSAALVDFLGKIVWVEPGQKVDPDPKTGRLSDEGAIITLGNLRQQAGGKVWVAISLYFGSLDATGCTYVVEKVKGSWTITGKTGPEWIA